MNTSTERDMTIPETTLLVERAPSSLTHRSLVAIGLADAVARIDSPLGPMFVAFNGIGISGVGAGADGSSFAAAHAEATGRPAMQVAELPARLAVAIARRLEGDRRARLPLDLRGRTDFEQAVLAKALEIPHGEVRPYGWIAAEIGRPRAFRAVGSALAHNPVPLVVPCHRVVRGDGMIGQYSLGGPDAKRTILRTEGVDPDELERLARTGIRYVASDSTGIFCLPTCRNARRIQAARRVLLRSAADGRRTGFRPCRVCRPAPAAVA
jgi:O-6-methylguanine DNA methyltransferase